MIANVARVSRYAATALVVGFFVLPIAYLASVSFKTKDDVLTGDFLPHDVLRNLRAEVDLFREANLPLKTQEAQLRIQYFKITGAQTVPQVFVNGRLVGDSEATLAWLALRGQRQAQ